MKILLINQTFYPDTTATAQQIFDLARHLVGEGHQVRVLCSRNAYEDPRRTYAAREIYEGIEIHRVRSGGAPKTNIPLRVLSSFVFQLRVLGWLVLSERPEVAIYFTSPPMLGVVGAVARLFRRERLVQWLMDVNPDAAIAVGYLKAASRTARFLRGIFGWSLRASDHVIVLDRYMRGIVEGYGVERARASIVSPWTAEGLLESVGRESGQRFRRENDLEGKFVVLFSGNHSIVHPLGTLLAAVRALGDDPSILFVFIGGGYRTHEVTRLVEELGLKNVRQLPHQKRERLPESLAAADLHVVLMGDAVNGLVHPSKIYGVLASGRPYLFIGPRASHLGDLVEKTKGGFSVENGDPRGVIEAIRRAQVLSDSEKRQVYAINTEFVRSCYSVESAISRLHGVFGH